MSFDGVDASAPQPLSAESPPHDAILAVEGGRIVTPSGTIENGSILLRGDRIARVSEDPTAEADRVIDARDRVVMPGIVDLHGDDFEQHLVPRSGAEIDPRTALLATDRHNVAHGITSKAHAIAFEEEGSGHRSPQRAQRLIGTLGGLPDLVGTNRVHARFELGGDLTAEQAASIVQDESVVLASIMHHVPGEGQYADPADFRDRYRRNVDIPPTAAADFAARRGNDERSDDVARRMVRIAEGAGIPVASHDDPSAQAVRSAAATGMGICEFPLSEDAALEARKLGMHTVMGAPNLVRGESLFENLRCERAIDLDALDVLCSDYHPPSLLHAPFVETGEPLHRRVARVTSAPADLIGATDRGRIAAGARADLVVVHASSRPIPTDVIVGGRHVWSTATGRS